MSFCWSLTGSLRGRRRDSRGGRAPRRSRRSEPSTTVCGSSFSARGRSSSGSAFHRSPRLGDEASRRPRLVLRGAEERSRGPGSCRRTGTSRRLRGRRPGARWSTSPDVQRARTTCSGRSSAWSSLPGTVEELVLAAHGLVHAELRATRAGCPSRRACTRRSAKKNVAVLAGWARRATTPPWWRSKPSLHGVPREVASGERELGHRAGPGRVR